MCVTVNPHDRINYLKREHFYECTCRACAERWPTHQDLSTAGMQQDIMFKCPYCSKRLGPFQHVWKALQRRTATPCCRADTTEVCSRVTKALKIPRTEDSSRERIFAGVAEMYGMFESPADFLIRMDMECMKKCMSDGNKQYLCDDMVFNSLEGCPMM